MFTFHTTLHLTNWFISKTSSSTVRSADENLAWRSELRIFKCPRLDPTFTTLSMWARRLSTATCWEHYSSVLPSMWPKKRQESIADIEDRCEVHFDSLTSLFRKWRRHTTLCKINQLVTYYILYTDRTPHALRNYNLKGLCFSSNEPDSHTQVETGTRMTHDTPQLSALWFTTSAWEPGSSLLLLHIYEDVCL